MKIKRILAGAVASVLAISTLAISASASIYVPQEDEEQPADGCDIGDGSWLIQIYNIGNEEEGKPATDYGINPWDIGSMTIYFDLVSGTDEALAVDVEDYDITLDPFGGSFIYSCNGGTIGTSAKKSDIYDEESNLTYYSKYNWPSNEWWGFPDPDDSAEGYDAGTNTGNVDYSKKLHTVYLNPYSYSLTYDIANDDTVDVRWPEGATCYQTGIQEWGGDYALSIKISLFVCRNDDGEIILAFDGLGNQLTVEEAASRVETLETPIEDSDSSTDESDETDENEGDNSEDTSEATSADTSTSEDSSTSSDSNNTTTIIIIVVVAVVVVAAIIIIIVVVSKKKKN